MGFLNDFVNFDKKVYSTAGDPAGLYNPDSASWRLSHGPTPAPPGYSDPSNTYISGTGSKSPGQGLANSLFQGGNTGYGNIINQGYQQLGQPATGDRSQIEKDLTSTVAGSFADRVYKQTGQLPTEDQIHQFLSETVTPGFAAKFIQGMPVDQINTMSDNYIQSKPDIISSLKPQAPANPSSDLNAVGTIKSLSDRLPGLYQGLSDQLGNVADTAFAAPRKAAIEDEAALGRLRSPASVGNIGAVDAAKASSLASGRYNLGLQQLQGQQDLGKTLASVQQSQQGIQNQASQFGQNLGLQQQGLGLQRQGLLAGLNQQDISNSLNQKQLDIASQLGKQQAEAMKPGWADYLSTALGGAANVAKTYAAFK